MTKTVFDNGGYVGFKGTFGQNLVSIVTSGLVLNLDAGNTDSYPGTGTTWTDLSGSGNHGTLANGPTFSTNQIIFDGADDIVNLNGITNVSNNFTYEVWCRPTATHEIDGQGSGYGNTGTSGQRFILGAWFIDPGAGAGVSVGTNGVSTYEHTAGWMPSTLVQSVAISSSVPTQIVLSYADRQPSLYINGAFSKLGDVSGRTPLYARVLSVGSGTYGAFQGGVYKVHVYNRSLSAAEVAKNFTALRTRFGI